MSEKICWYSPLGRGKWPFYKRVKFRSGKRLSRASIAFFFSFFFLWVLFCFLVGWLFSLLLTKE